MANIYETLRSKYAYVTPGQAVVIGDYVGKPKSSTWFFIEDLEQVRSFLKRQGMTLSPRFRGPRQTVYNVNSSGRQYYRGAMTRKYTCLKDEAKFFSISFK